MGDRRQGGLGGWRREQSSSRQRTHRPAEAGAKARRGAAGASRGGARSASAGRHVSAESRSRRAAPVRGRAPRGKSSEHVRHARVRQSGIGRVSVQRAPESLHGGRADETAVERVLGSAAVALLFALRMIGRSVAFVLSLIGGGMRRSRVFAVVFVVAALAGVLVVADTALTGGVVHRGVSIGEVDVSGMTPEEAASAVREVYGQRVEQGRVIVFADEETASSVDVEQQLVQDQALAEQISFEEAQKSKKLWIEDAVTLGAVFPAEALADEAFAVGRGVQGVFDRAAAFFGGWDVAPHVELSQDSVERLASDVDSAIGEPRVDYSLAIEQGKAEVVEGHDGSMVNRADFSASLGGALLDAADGEGMLVAHVEYAPLRIDAVEAQRACEAVNGLISSGARFAYDGRSLDVSPEMLGDWIGVRLGEAGDSFFLDPYVDRSAATPALVALVNKDATGSDVDVSFAVEGDDVTVELAQEITVPLLGEALDTLDANLFGAYRTDRSQTSPVLDPVEITTRRVSGSLSFDEAYSYGIVTEISSYTTQYVSTESTQNRTHNIHLVSDLLNNSVAKADGGTWSFNDTAGNCNAEAGFLPAGAIAGDEYIDEEGGGICQVATTVFNAVYDAGYPMVSRANHTLYVASYPAGRDAAVSYPDLDYIWQNDTASDVLLRTSYTDSSVTVTLYGVDPERVVTSETGEWVEGKKYDTKTVVDDTLPPGTTYTKTAGTDGMEITVYRTVKTKDGDLVRNDSFRSIYAPVTEVVVTGPAVEEDFAGESSKQKDDAAA